MSAQLFAGTNANVVALEIHQRSNSDIVFDLELTGSGAAGTFPSR